MSDAALWVLGLVGLGLLVSLSRTAATTRTAQLGAKARETKAAAGELREAAHQVPDRAAVIEASTERAQARHQANVSDTADPYGTDWLESPATVTPPRRKED